MEFFAEMLLSEGRLNGALFGAVFGALGGLFGLIAGKALSSILNKDGLVKWTVIFFVVISFQVPSLIKPYLEETYGTSQKEKNIENVMVELESQRLFSVIFRYHPDARSRLADKMMDIIYNNGASEAEVSRLSQIASSEIVGEYFQKHLPAASNEQIAALLNRNHQILVQFKSKPSLCVGYYLGQPEFSPSDITPEFIKLEGDMKADIIESAVQNPSIPPRAASSDEVADIIVQAYENKKYSLENLSKIEAIHTLEPNEGCSVAIEFSDVLASLDAKTGGFVFKNLMFFGSEDSQN